MEHGLRLSRPRSPARSSRRVIANGSPQPLGLSGLQHAAGRISPTCACARRCRCCSISNGSTRTIFFNLYQRSGELLRRLRPVRLRPCPRTIASARCCSRSPARCAPTSWTAPGRPARQRRLAAATARRCDARSACLRRPATSCPAACLRRKATGQPFTFEILTTTRDQERVALAFARDLKRAGHHAVGPRRSMRCNSISADSPTTST